MHHFLSLSPITESVHIPGNESGKKANVQPGQHPRLPVQLLALTASHSITVSQKLCFSCHQYKVSLYLYSRCFLKVMQIDVD